MIGRAIVSLVLFAASSSMAANEERAPLQSRRAAEAQFDALVAESRKLSAEIAELNTFAAVIDQARKCLAQKAPDDKMAADTLAYLRTAVADLKKLPADTAMLANSPIGARLANGANQLYAYTGGMSFECMQRVMPVFRGPGQPSLEPALDAIKEAAFPMRAPTRSIDGPPKHFSAFFAIVGTLSPVEGRRRSDLNENILRAEAELAQANVDTFKRMHAEAANFYGKGLDAMTAALRGAVEQRGAKIQEIEKQLADVDKMLVDRQAAQQALDKGLLWAVYLMIFALMALFLSLRLFDRDLAKQIVTDRSMVELISMAFILLTIIILGTGGKIGNETIGTLLGTIAGYVFARKLAEGEKPKTTNDEGQKGKPGHGGGKEPSGTEPEVEKPEDKPDKG
jgi:hypothetical protein